MRKRQSHEEIVAIMFGNLDLWEQREQAAGGYDSDNNSGHEMEYFVDEESNTTNATSTVGSGGSSSTMTAEPITRAPSNPPTVMREFDGLLELDDSARTLLIPNNPTAATASLPLEIEMIFDRYQRRLDQELHQKMVEIQDKHAKALRAELASILSRTSSAHFHLERGSLSTSSATES
jgi:hypothetical protein